MQIPNFSECTADLRYQKNFQTGDERYSSCHGFCPDHRRPNTPLDWTLYFNDPKSMKVADRAFASTLERLAQIRMNNYFVYAIWSCQMWKEIEDYGVNCDDYVRKCTVVHAYANFFVSV
jgi:hypothetical protein